VYFYFLSFDKLFNITFSEILFLFLNLTVPTPWENFVAVIKKKSNFVDSLINCNTTVASDYRRNTETIFVSVYIPVRCSELHLARIAYGRRQAQGKWTIKMYIYLAYSMQSIRNRAWRNRGNWNKLFSGNVNRLHVDASVVIVIQFYLQDILIVLLTFL